MIKSHKNNINYFEFNLLKKLHFISHGVICRNRLINDQELDCNFDSSKVLTNPSFIKIKETFSFKDLAVAKQVHNDHIECVDTHNVNNSFICDGFITSSLQIPLLIKHADCQATLFVDPVNKVIANVHCGWRGSILNIYQKTIHKMVKEFRSEPRNILVCISPSLGPDHAEFIHYKDELPKLFWPFKRKDFLFDFWEISKYQLLQAGILDSHIEMANICTYKNFEDFFSYRRNRTQKRNLTFICLTH